MFAFQRLTGVCALCPIFGKRWTFQMVLLRDLTGNMYVLTSSQWEMSGLPFLHVMEQSFHKTHIQSRCLSISMSAPTCSIRCSVWHKESNQVRGRAVCQCQFRPIPTLPEALQTKEGRDYLFQDITGRYSGLLWVCFLL